MRYLLLLALLFTLPAEASLTLEGSVDYTEGKVPEGRIGIKVETKGKILVVHKSSPAFNAGLLKDDVVLLVDGLPKNVGNISGLPGTIVNLVLVRHGQEFKYSIERVSRYEIKD